MAKTPTYPCGCINWKRIPLGKFTDAVIAERYGIGLGWVQKNRAKLGIIACKQKSPQLLAELVYEAVRSKTSPVPVRVIHERVCEEFGRVTIRQVYRVLRRLRETALLRVTEGHTREWGYVRR